MTIADGFFAIIPSIYGSADRGLYEQFAKDTGAPLSAGGLAWSYASTLTPLEVLLSRAGVREGLVVPTICGTNPVPNSTLRFRVYAETNFQGGSSFLPRSTHTRRFAAENVFITGNIHVIGSWNPGNANHSLVGGLSFLKMVFNTRRSFVPVTTVLLLMHLTTPAGKACDVERFEELCVHESSLQRGFQRLYTNTLHG